MQDQHHLPGVRHRVARRPAGPNSFHLTHLPEQQDDHCQARCEAESLSCLCGQECDDLALRPPVVLWMGGGSASLVVIGADNRFPFDWSALPDRLFGVLRRGKDQ